MRRTEQLQGLRLMKFEDIYGRTYRGELSQMEAAEVLGMPLVRLSVHAPDDRREAAEVLLEEMPSRVRQRVPGLGR